jgi:hypothetical protein
MTTPLFHISVTTRAVIRAFEIKGEKNMPEMQLQHVDIFGSFYSVRVKQDKILKAYWLLNTSSRKLDKSETMDPEDGNPTGQYDFGSPH